MRAGITSLMLNAVIGIVLVSMVFSVAFFAYSSVVNSLTQSQVTKGFESFVNPIQEVCQGKSQAVAGNINLPLSNDYTYGIFQTRLRTGDYQPPMPLVMRKCENSYCLCLFRQERPPEGWEFWDDTDKGLFDADYFPVKQLIDTLGVRPPTSTKKLNPAPLWHFNTAGNRIFPTFITRVTTMMVVRVVGEWLVKRIINHFVADLSCKFGCTTTGPALILCQAACTGVMYGIIYAIARGIQEGIFAYLEETTEPFLLVNYPLSFMSTSDDELLYWKGQSSFDVFQVLADSLGITVNELLRRLGLEERVCYNNNQDCLIPELGTAKLSGDDWRAIGLSAGAGAVQGFAEGFFAGFTEGLQYSIYDSGTSGKVDHKFIELLKKIGKKTTKTVALGVGALTIKTGAFWAEKELLKAAAFSALDFEIKGSYRPQANVRTLLGVRRIMNLEKFITMFGDLNNLLHPFASRAPSYDYSFDNNVITFDGFDVINCVSINELGPQCDSDTKILMDYTGDVILSYRITDPINSPHKAIFCGYAPESQEFGINLVYMARDAIKNEVLKSFSQETQDVLGSIIDFFAEFINLVIGEWLLAGQHSINGLFMECIQGHYDEEHRSEYFQYWVPYGDQTGYVGNTGQIGIMTATKTQIPENQCQDSVKNNWNSCVCQSYAKTHTSSYNQYMSGISAGYLGIYELASCKPESNEYSFETISKNTFAVCPIGVNENCDYSADWNYNATCKDIYQPEYVSCIEGIHVRFSGVIQ